MHSYAPGRWGLCFAFTFKGSVFPKSFTIALPCSLFCGVLHILFRTSWKFLLANADVNASVNVVGGFTMILGFLIVIKCQQAYSRWWEGGTLLQQTRGEWFNSYSNILAFANPAPERRKDVNAFQNKLMRLYSLMYASALEQVTTMEDPVFEIIELRGFDLKSLLVLSSSHDKCEVVLQWLQKLIMQANACEVIKVAPPILTRVYNQLGNGIVNLNNVRKITEFPIPFPLAQMVTLMLICHGMMTALICAAWLDQFGTSVMACFLVVFSYWTINYITLELEMPFGDDPNDLPLEDMQRDFNASLKSLLHPQCQEPPHFEQSVENSVFATTTMQLKPYIELLAQEAEAKNLPAGRSVILSETYAPRRKNVKRYRGNNDRNANPRQPGVSDERRGSFTTFPLAGTLASLKAGRMSNQSRSAGESRISEMSLFDGTALPLKGKDLPIEESLNGAVQNGAALIGSCRDDDVWIGDDPPDESIDAHVAETPTLNFASGHVHALEPSAISVHILAEEIRQMQRR